MKSRPTLFLSGVSHEFSSFRDAVENEIEMKGCFAENQPGFPPDYRTVEEMLRRKLKDSDAVIHIVGFRFGAEPNQRPADKPRRSYTQMEFDIAREMNKPVFVFISSDASVRDPLKRDDKTGAEIPDSPQDDEATALQLAHRDAVQKTNHLYYVFKDKAELCKLVAEIPIVAAAGFNADISRILKYAPSQLIGRELETALLDDAWAKVQHHEKGRPHILTFVALGGEGKTSLVAKWAADLAAQDWPGCDAVFAWSFYSQGTREQTAVSSDLFLAEALTFFGDEAMAKSAQGAFEKGKRLAQLVGERRALLILDGLEPLQYAPTSPTPGELKDQGLGALLKGLAATSQGLCVVTTRYALPDLRAFLGRTVREEKLARLAWAAGVQLLKAHGVTGSDRPNLPHTDDAGKKEMLSEFEKLVEDVKGHALTLNLLGTYLRDAHAGDIRKRGLVKLKEADANHEHKHHAFHVMDAYVKWLAPSGFRARLRRLFSEKEREHQTEGKRALALLRLMGLFDRPATADCLAALWKAPAIPGLTKPLIGLSEAQRNVSLKRLEDAKLLTVNRDASGTLVSLDAHPLLREYFAQRLKDEGRTMKAGSRPSSSILPTSSFCLAHRRLYEHLCASTQEGDQPTLEALQPLYQAVAHGCQAGLQQEAWDTVFYARVVRGSEKYSKRKLGAFGSDLGAIACFFETPWNRVSSALTENDQSLLFDEAAFSLRALGRLTESVEPMRVSGEMDVKMKAWENAATSYSNLSELELTLGEVAGAVGDAEHSVTYADRSGDAAMRMITRTVTADALHQAGRRAEAEARFREAEQMQAERQPAYPLLYSLPGFRYCDLLLAEAERAVWQVVVAGLCEPGGVGLDPRPSKDPKTGPTMRDGSSPTKASEEMERLGSGVTDPSYNEPLRAVSERAAQTLKWAEQHRAALLTIALDHLTLGRAALYAAILTRSDGILPSDQDQRRQDAVAPWETAFRELESAVSGLRRAGQNQELPRGLLTRACQRSLTGALTSAQAGPDSAQSDLDEAWEIAERGPMPLFLADIHLHRARLFFREATYPWNHHPDGSPRGPADDLAAARAIITKVTTFTKPDGTVIQASYGRRLPELEDAERAILRP